jgi:hypothetical protein
MTTHSLDEVAIVDLWLPVWAVWIFHSSIATGWGTGHYKSRRELKYHFNVKIFRLCDEVKNGLTRNPHPVQCNISLRRQGVAFAGISGETKTLAEY